MKVSQTLNAQWFEVVDGETIVFAGPLEACGGYVIRNSGHALTIRLCTF